VGAVDGEEMEVCHVLEVGDSFLVVVNTSLYLSLDRAAQHRNYGLRFNYEPVLNFSLELEKILEKGSETRQENTFVTRTTVNQYNYWLFRAVDYLHTIRTGKLLLIPLACFVTVIYNTVHYILVQGLGSN